MHEEIDEFGSLLYFRTTYFHSVVDVIYNCNKLWAKVVFIHILKYFLKAFEVSFHRHNLTNDRAQRISKLMTDSSINERKELLFSFYRIVEYLITRVNDLYQELITLIFILF